MKGIEDDGIVKHRSADDLDDGYISLSNRFKNYYYNEKNCV